MAICNCDGTPYQLSSNLAQFDPTSKETDLFNLYDEEAISLGGSPIFYFEVFIGPNTTDPLYREDRGKVWAADPIKLFCLYEPIPGQNYMSTMGIDAPDELQFEFNYKAVLRAIGHPPKIGSRLMTPHRGEHWEIVQRNLGEFRFWGALRLTILARRFQENRTTNEGSVTQPQTDFKLNEGSLLNP